MKTTIIDDKERLLPRNRLKEFPENVLGVVRAWEGNHGAVGHVVVRNGDVLMDVECKLLSTTKEDDSWPGRRWSLKRSYDSDLEIYIEVLDPGTTIQITI